MENKSFNLQFSERLRELMVKRGYASRSASSGVSPAALCKAIGCFSETALRYLDGRSVPSPDNILKISDWLQVEPGFLLFGTQGYKNATQEQDTLTLNKDFLDYAFKKMIPIINNTKKGDEVVEFFISILSDLSHLQIELTQLKQVFDLAIKSSTFFGKEVVPEILIMENQEQKIKLHPEAKFISFKHKIVILEAFKRNLQATFGIDYFSLMIVDSLKIISLYSTSPALEFNLINNNLWQHDGVFAAQNHKDGAFIFWDELYDAKLKSVLIKEKELNFGFQFGFSIMKKLHDIFVIYSFATKTHHNKEIFEKSKDIYTKMGDYFFIELAHVHQQYIIRQDSCLSTKENLSTIKLIVDNTKKQKFACEELST